MLQNSLILYGEQFVRDPESALRLSIHQRFGRAFGTASAFLSSLLVRS
jgi:hypothetical protein